MLDIILRPLKDVVVDPLILLLKNLKVSPNVFTLLSGLCGLIGVYYSTVQMQWHSLVFFLLTRLLDGIDGAYARATNQCTEFGGYLDIIVDFTIYGLIPIGVTMGTPEGQEPAWVAMGVLLNTFFVNAAGLFFLSALIEKNQNAKRKYGDKKELTTVSMPPALIEGTESYIFFGLMILFGDNGFIQASLYWLFSLGVTITILQRLWWAYKNLD
ncbi:hypothetical protein FGO68_gene7422 [Halteria grandinella]|uniref:CDP-alcohol phosphatidyltransferase family protein n=1 Tax=Halteria grandinella TaxID=5974 RepID=A0A8J8SYR9_HALGN|nr:hypothetical protein FGO68_gene7422 [Halteria grandinella]